MPQLKDAGYFAPFPLPMAPLPLLQQVNEKKTCVACTSSLSSSSLFILCSLVQGSFLLFFVLVWFLSSSFVSVAYAGMLFVLSFHSDRSPHGLM